MNDSEIVEVLSRLQHDGRLRDVDVVNEARNETSPLHKHFTWDDTEAAERYRLIEARTLIRRVKIEVVIRDLPLNVVRFVHDPIEPGTYREINAIRLNEDDVARRVVMQEMMKVSRAAKRARSVAAVLGTTADVEEIIRIANTVVRRAEANDQPTGNA